MRAPSRTKRQKSGPTDQMPGSLLLGLLALVALAAPHNIKHVVVLMEENRSFDHLLGYFNQINPNVDGLTGHETNPINTSQPNGAKVKVNDKSPDIAKFDPLHDINSVTQQIFGDYPPVSTEPTMNGFVQTAHRYKQEPAGDVMNMWDPSHVPVITSLASEFVVFDRWYASLPGPTNPNRLFSMSCTSHGSTDNHSPEEGWPQKTIFDSLTESGHTWKIYYHDFSWALQILKNLRSHSSLLNIQPFHYFLADAKNGKLPTFTWIEPRVAVDPWTNESASDMHPDHSVAVGEKLIKQVYEAVRNSPQWHESLFVLTYDEHGGYYDHVPTPVEGIPKPDNNPPSPPSAGFNFDRLGVRIPTIMASPWISKGTVVHEPTGPTPTSHYEHSSLHATLKKLFGLKDFLTERDKWAGTFEGVLNLEAPREDCPTELPEPRKLLQNRYEGDLKLNDLQCSILRGFAGLQDISCDMDQITGANFIQKHFKTLLDGQ
jgi:phospholipase C